MALSCLRVGIILWNVVGDKNLPTFVSLMD